MKRILIIDDEAAINRLLKSYLESKGYTVDTARNGKEGLTSCLKTKYDLIISDLSPPYLDGIHTMKQIINANSNQKASFIFMSADPSEEIRKAVYEIGGVALLGKPLDILEFERSVTQAVRNVS